MLRHYGDTVIKKLWYWWKNSCIEQWNRIKNLELNQHTYAQLIADMMQEQLNEGKIVFTTMVIEKLDIYRQK